MNPVSVMLVAGEASGDLLASELVAALRPALVGNGPATTDVAHACTGVLAPRFFGAGGPRMAAAGVELILDMTVHTVFGLTEALQQLARFRRIFRQLLRVAMERQPDLIVLVDFAGFNRRFAGAVMRHVRSRAGLFNNWRPRIVYFVSPQVWASREGRARQLARDVDLLLSIFPFEKAWYQQRVPQLPVAFVGHPLIDRYAGIPAPPEPETARGAKPRVLLLPGSRRQELRRHLPVLVEAVRMIQRQQPVALRMVLPDERLRPLVERHAQSLPGLQLQIGGLSNVLAQSDLALAKSGTVVLECAYFRVPTVVIYRAAWPTYLLARLLVRVRHVAMPNLLAGRELFPEFLQHRATPSQVARNALALLRDAPRRREIRQHLDRVIDSLGGPGACRRAAQEITELLFRAGPENR